MPRPVFRKKASDGPPAKGRLSLWLCLVMAALALAIIVHVSRPAASAKMEQTQPALAPKPLVQQQDREPAFEHQPANRFSSLAHDWGKEMDASEREDLLLAWLAKTGTEEIPGWLEYLQTAVPTDLAQDLSKRLLRLWAERLPQNASQWLGRLPADQQLALLDDVAVPWANSNATNAVNWARSLPNDAARRQAMAAVAGEVIRSQPVLALGMALDLPAGPQRDDLIHRGVMQWASEDAEGAAAWVKQIPAGDLRNEAISGVAIAWSTSEPVAAANLALDELPPGRLLQDTVISIVQRWAQQQPEAAAAWADQFAAGPLRDTAIENIRAQVQRQHEAETSTGTSAQQM